MRRYQTTTFVVLAFVTTWTAWLPIVLAGSHVTQGRAWPTHLPGLLGPAVAAAATIAMTQGRAGITSWLRRCSPSRLPLWALAFSGMTLLLGLGVMAFRSGDLVGSATLSGTPDLGLPLTFVLILLVNGLGEEAGWRGFLVDRVLPENGLVRTSAVVSIVWGLWHLPMFFVLDSFRSLGPAVVGWAFGLFCGSVVLTWLYAASGGSVLAVALWHTSYNFGAGTAGAEGAPAVVTSTAVVLFAMVLVARERRTLRHVRPQVPVS